jgi:hypothetical protein
MVVVIIITLAAAGVVTFLRAKKQGAAILPAVVGAYQLTLGAMILVLSLIHLGAILWEPIAGKGPAGAVSFDYNFRYYSLLLVGFVQAVPAFLLLGNVKGLVWQKQDAWKGAVRVSIVLLAVNLPLTPIQGFAAAFSIFVAVNLFFLYLSRKYYL